MNLSCNVAQMKRAIGYFKSVNDEILMDFKPEGLRIWTKDASTVMCLDMYAEKASFIMFNCTEPRTICISSEDFHKAFSRIMDDDFLFVSIPENGNTMIINIMKRDKSKIIRSREFILPLIELKFQIQDIKCELPNSFTISSLLWKTAIQDMGASASDYKGSLVVHLSKDKILFKAGSVGEVKSKVEYYKSELRGLNIQDTAVGDYNLRYMYEFFKQMPDDMFLQFNIFTERPLKCQFEASDAKLSVLSDTKPFKFTFFIAPYKSFEQPPQQAEEEGGLEVGGIFESPELDKLQDSTKSKEEKKDEVKS